MENRVSQLVSADERKGTPDNPLVSIITPVLNGIKYLEACIQSVLNQSYPLIEHIFVDGGSTDGTVEMLASYRAKYPDRIRFVSEPDKGAGEAWDKGLRMAKGAGEAWDKGLRMAKGEILGWLGSDDMSEPDAIQIVVEFFKSNPDAYFVFGDCNHINEKGEIIGKYPTRDFNLKEMINDSNPIPGPSAFYRREVIEKVRLMDTSMIVCDFDYWIRVGKVFQIHRIEKVLSNFRIHKESQRGSKEGAKFVTRQVIIMSRRHGGRFLSGYRRKYYEFIIIESLRPVLGPAYPFINKVLSLLHKPKA